VVNRDADRIGQEGNVPGSGTSPGPAGTSGSGAYTNPYPVYGDGAGLGVGSASEEASAKGKCCGGSLGSSSPSQAAPLFTGSAIEAEPSRTDFLADPLVPAPPALVPVPSVPSGIPPRPPDPFGPGRIARSMFAPPTDCARAPCEGFVRAQDWMVQFVRTGATWPALPGRRFRDED
jgi:hypothetical protein